MSHQRNLLNDLNDLAQLGTDASATERAIERARAALNALPAERAAPLISEPSLQQPSTVELTSTERRAVADMPLGRVRGMSVFRLLNSNG